MYKAVLSKISHVRPHPNADRLNIATVLGYQIIVGKDLKEGDKVVFFEGGGQLSEEFSKENNLYRDATKNKNPEANPGMFEDNRRVKSIRLRGERSDGFVVPLSYFSYIKHLDLNSYEEGTTFDSIDGHQICRKYETPSQIRARESGQGKKVKRGETPMFRMHPDTEQYQRESYKLFNESPCIIYATEKLHGTSHRIGHVLEETLLWETKKGISRFICKLFTPKKTTKVWTYLNGSRRVVLDAQDKDKTRNSFYGTDEFRNRAVEGITLHKGEVLYGEIVGWVDMNTPIMARQSAKVFKSDKAILNYINVSADDEITFTYGQAPGQCKFYVYRISQVNEDGNSVELSWPQVISRCKELGVEPVPTVDTYYYDGTDSCEESIRRSIDFTYQGGVNPMSILDDSHLAEGIVLRAEFLCGKENVTLKAKSSIFMNLEGYQREIPDFIDMEDVS